MSTRLSFSNLHTIARVSAGLFCLGLIVSCGPSSEDKLTAEIACSQYAVSQSGYTPANPPGGSSSVGKGAAAGAVGGAAIGAASGSKKKTVEKVAIGAAAGAAAGAGLGAIKDNEDEKKAAQARAAYQSEFQTCMTAKGF